MSSRPPRVPLAPEARHGESEERQRSPLALDRGQHLVGQALLEAEALRPRGLDERAPERVAGRGAERHQAVEDRPEPLVVVAAHQEVVAHREKDAHVGLGRETAEEGREAGLALGRVEGEELLELVHDHDGRDVSAPPAGEEGEGALGVVESHQEPESLGVAREVGREGLAQLLEGRRARGAHDHGPAGRLRGGDAGPDEGRLARAGRPDDTQQPLVPQPLPDPPHLGLATEETARVRLGERPQAGVGAALLVAGDRPASRQRPLEHRLEREGQVVRRVEALVPVLVQAATDHPVEHRGQRAEDGAQRRRVVVQHRRDGVRGRGAGERATAAEGLVQDRSQGEEVCTPIRREPARLLGREVAHGAHQEARLRVRVGGVAAVRPRQAGDPEVEDLDPPVRGEEDVVGLQVAVDDGAPVRGLEPVAHLDRELDRGSQGHRPALEALPEALALQELENEVGTPAGGADVEDGQDVRVGEGGDGSRLVLEAAEALGRGLRVGEDDLDRDVAAETGVVGAVHLRHSTGAQQLPDLVGPEPYSRSQRHGRSVA